MSGRVAHEVARSPTLSPPPQLEAYEFELGERRFVLFEWAPEQPARPLPVALTPALSAVLRLLLQGKSTKEIARARNSSERTVANQIAAVFRKFGVHSRCELAAHFANVAEAPDA